MKISTIATFLMYVVMSSALCTQQITSDQLAKHVKNTNKLSALALAKGAGYTAFSITDIACVGAALALVYGKTIDVTVEFPGIEKFEALSAIIGFLGASGWFGYKAYRTVKPQDPHATATSKSKHLLWGTSLVCMKALSLVTIFANIPNFLYEPHIKWKATQGLILSLLAGQALSLAVDLYHEKDQFLEDICFLKKKLK